MQRLLGVLVCLCLVVQPLAVFGHLASAEHTYGERAPVAAFHGHGHHVHAHPHAHPHAAEPSGDARDDGHPAHPAEDHLAQQQEQLRATPFPSAPTLALPPLVELFTDAAVGVAPLPERARDVPLRPPPRGPTHPRAPPATA